MAGYAVIFGGFMLFFEMKLGVKAIQRLDRTYPYNDDWLLPAVFYSWGWLKHTPRGNSGADSNGKLNTDDLESITNNEGDGDQDGDERIEEFLLVAF